MPNASQRITDSTIKGMLSMFLMFNSLDDRFEINFHPKFIIIINNVSKHGDDYDIDAIEKDPTNASINSAASLSVEKRIKDIKFQLKEGAINFYFSEEISESTRVGEKKWKDIKDQVCNGESYKQEAWFTELKDHEKTLLSDLKQIQLKLGTDKSIEPQRNYIRAKFIEDRID